MKSYNLRLVRHWLSVGLFVFTIMFFLFFLILIGLIYGTLPIISLLLVFGIFIFIMWKYYDKLLIKYSRTLKICDDYFEFDNRRYNWDDVDWHRTDNSAIMNAFVIGIKGASSLKFHVTNKNSDELEVWQNMKEGFLKVLSLKNINVRNYYNSIFWRRTGRILLASNLIIPIALALSGIAFFKILPGFLVWLGTSLTFAIMIFNNQKNKASII